MLNQVLGYTNNVTVKVALSLFDKQIQPILRRIEIKVKQVNNIHVCNDRLSGGSKIWWKGGGA